MILLGYTPAQWVLFFFLYSFLGWIWESSFVSIREHRWVNRGFLHGPLLPIYGFGAVSILLFTLPVAQNPLLIFLMGMTGATLLEYITGYAMERMFHVRYWDYSMYRWNLNGYICLPASLCWGVFSLVMVKLIHPLLGGWTASLPETLAVPAALTLAGLTTADMFVSLREAVEMRSLLSSLSESKRRIAWLQKRLEVQAAFAPQHPDPWGRYSPAVRRGGKIRPGRPAAGSAGPAKPPAADAGLQESVILRSGRPGNGPPDSERVSGHAGPDRSHVPAHGAASAPQPQHCKQTIWGRPAGYGAAAGSLKTRPAAALAAGLI